MSPLQAQDPASLGRLHDLVEPAPIPSWPPAPGWWVLVAVLGAWIALLALAAWRRYRDNTYRRAALAELGALTISDPDPLPALLKRTALAAWPREQVASLSGEAWLSFLDRTGHTTDFTQGAGRLLLALSYETGDLTDQQSSQLHEIVWSWIRDHRRESQG